MTFATDKPVWAAVGVRPDEASCRMNPANVGIVHESMKGEGMDYYFGELPAALRMGSPDAMLEVSTMQADPSEIEDASHKFEDGMMTFDFIRSMEGLGLNGEDSDLIPITWAIGSTPVMKYHMFRSCATLDDVPACGDVDFDHMHHMDHESEGDEDHDNTDENCSGGLDEMNEKIEDLQKGMKMLLCGQMKSEDGCSAHIDCKWHSDHQSCSFNE